MIETLIAYFTAHVLADYVFQTNKMAQNKAKPPYLLLHGVIVTASLITLTGSIALPVLAIAALHLITDAIKAQLPNTIQAHIGDQLIHLITLTSAAYLYPDVWQTGLWANAPFWASHIMLIIAGAIYATRAGGFAISILMRPYGDTFSQDSLPQGGQMIGFLERGLIYILILAGLPIGIGFLVAAKSVLRFETSKDGETAENRKRSEYVIIGTLASFGWAILVSMAIVLLWLQLPDLGISLPKP